MYIFCARTEDTTVTEVDISRETVSTVMAVIKKKRKHPSLNKTSKKAEAV